MVNILVQKAIKKFMNDKCAVVALCFLVLFSAFIFITPFFFEKNYFFKINFDVITLSPCLKYIFGTDNLGRDVFIRTIVASKISLEIALIATLIAVGIGTLYGMVAGFYGKKIDNIMMRFVDGINSVPFIFLAILFVSIFGNDFLFIYAAIACVSWLDIARIVRGQTISLKNKEFIEAAKISGLSNNQIIFRHIFPNLLGSIIMYTTLVIPNILALSTFLGFLGLGVQPPMIGLGELINDGSQQIVMGHWWLLIFPCLFLFLILLCMFFISNGIKNAINTKM